jgi:hypothetical protein
MLAPKGCREGMRVLLLVEAYLSRHCTRCRSPNIRRLEALAASPGCGYGLSTVPERSAEHVLARLRLYGDGDQPPRSGPAFLRDKPVG